MELSGDVCGELKKSFLFHDICMLRASSMVAVANALGGPQHLPSEQMLSATAKPDGRGRGVQWSCRLFIRQCSREGL